MASGVIRKTYVCFPCYFVYDECNDRDKEEQKLLDRRLSGRGESHSSKVLWPL